MPKKAGRPTETLKVEGSWKEAVGAALAKKRPTGGWPKESAETKPRKKKRAK